VSAPADDQTTATCIDTYVTDAFRAYHHDQAILLILSWTANPQTCSQARRPRVARLDWCECPEICRSAGSGSAPTIRLLPRLSSMV